MSESKSLYAITGRIKDVNTLLVQCQELEAITQAARQALEALAGMLAIVDDSQAVAGYHLNGELEPWGGFPEVEAARAAITALREALDYPKQDLDPAARNGWAPREVLFANGEPVGHRGPQVVGAVQEPVAYLYCGGQFGGELDEWEIDPEQYHCDKLNEHFGALGKEARIPLFTAPQPTRQPLSDKQIQDIWCSAKIEGNQHGPFWFARAIERAHGIGGEA